eukprot:2264776-Pyramimonas_sp.AAC.1
MLVVHEGICLTDFVDDLLGSGPSREDAAAKLAASVRFFLRVGIPVSSKPSGLREPSQRQTWVGWIFDTSRNELSVEKKKCDKCIKLFRDVLQANATGELRARALASAAGLASHISEVFLQGRRRLHHIWSLLNSSNVYAIWANSPAADPLLRLTPDCS